MTDQKLLELQSNIRTLKNIQQDHHHLMDLTAKRNILCFSKKKTQHFMLETMITLASLSTFSR